MIAITGIFTVFLAIQAANTYILLTANLEDVQTLAKQLAASPVVEQINRIWRRASNQFNQHLSRSRIQKRVNEELDEEAPVTEDASPKSREVIEPERSSYLTEDRDNLIARRKQDTDDLVALGKNASLYLKSIKKIFEKV